MIMAFGKFYGILIAMIALCLSGAMCPRSFAGLRPEGSWSVAAYGGQWSNNRIGEILYLRTDLKPSHVWAVALTREVYTLVDGLTAEVEFNSALHSGRQHHAEVSGAFLLRWRRFPWDRFLNLSVAYGVGPSLAFRRPPIEQRSRREATYFLLSMPVELTFGLPDRFDVPWHVLLRVHHRSGAYGVVSDAGGSNFVTAGIRRFF